MTKTFGREASVQQGSFWVIVLLEPESRGVRSVHCCVDQTPNNRVCDVIHQEGLMRTIWVQASNIQDALYQAIDRGILVF